MILKRNEKVVYIVEASLFGALIAFGLFSLQAGEVFKSYYIVVVLAILCVIMAVILGNKRSKNYLSSSALRYVIAFCLLFGIISYTLGLILSFNLSYLSFDLQKNLCGLVPAAVIIVLSELLRRQIYNSYARGKKAIICFSLLVILMGVLLAINAQVFSDAESIFVFVTGTIFPIIATELLCAYLCRNFGIVPGLTFRLATGLYFYIIPIVPNLGPYIQTVLHLILATLIYFFCSKTLASRREDQQKFRRFGIGFLTIPLVAVTATVVCLVSGIFDYQIIAIGSNSMLPHYGRGDAVIFQKLAPEQIQEDDILVFRRENIIVTHRVTKVVKKDDQLYFQTKGDAEAEPNEELVQSGDVIGRVVTHSKYIGYPTIWLSDIFNGGKND